MKLVLEPIGVVRNDVSGLHGQVWAEVVSRIEIRPELESALDGLEDFSHVIA